MSKMHEFDTNFPSAESLDRRILAIKKSQQKVLNGLQRNALLFEQDPDASFLFVIRSGANRIVPAPHYKVALVPRARQSESYGIAKLIIAVPLYDGNENADLPKQLLDTSDDVSEYKLGNDVFVEARSAGDRSLGHYLISPEGFSAYHSAEDIVPFEQVLASAQARLALDHVFTVSPDSFEATLMPGEFENMITAAVIDYEPTLQDNRSRSPE